MNSTGCGGHSGFLTVGSASSYSALAGVIAGVLFTGIVLLITLSPTESQQADNRKAAIEVMTPAFFVMLTTSFLFAVIAGEQTCRRAEIEAVAAGALLAVGAVATFQALAWMLASIETINTRLPLIAASTRFVVALLGVGQLAVTAEDVKSEYTNGASLSATAVIGFFVLGVCAVFVVGALWFKRKPLLEDHVWITAPTLLGCLGVEVVVFDLAANRDVTHWAADAAPVFVPVVLVITMVTFVLSMIIHILAAPARP